jgi:predicted GH43/DUF377 family glycosyl hydrolase
LVDGKNGGKVGYVGSDTKSTSVLESSRSIETTGTVVVTSDFATCFREIGQFRRSKSKSVEGKLTSSEEFCDRYTLAFSSRYTTNEVVSDLGVVSVLETEKRSKNVSSTFDRFLPRVDATLLGGSTSCGSESEGLLDSEERHVNIICCKKNRQFLLKSSQSRNERKDSPSGR